MISAVVLAAGLSERMGRPKLLEKLDNQTIIEHVVDNVQKSAVEETVVVLGANQAEVFKVLADRRVLTAYNARYKEGQGSSVALGASVVNPAAEGILFLMGDQPLVSTELINRLICEFNRSDALVVRLARSGTPAIFSTKLQDELASLSGDIGGRQLFTKYYDKIRTFEMGGPETMDIDTEEDLEEARRLWENIMGRRKNIVREEDSPKENG